MKSLVIGTAGHIDHGKSALVRALTGTDPDRLKEEKARGITIDLGFAHAEVGGVSLAFVDVPGHERFVKNMLAGAGGIDLVLLVIAADESVMPQTREHFQICRLLQVPAGLVALTKADLADEETRELSRMEVRELVAGSFLEGAPIVEVSSKTGEGLDALRRAIVERAALVPGRAPGGVTRLPIDRVFSVKGFGTVVTGTLVSGTLEAERELEVLPRRMTVKVRGVQVHGRAERSASAGRRVAVNLGGADVDDLTRGDTLCAPGAFTPTRRFDAAIQMLADARPMKHGTRVRFHQGTTERLGRVALASTIAEQASSAEVAPGGRAYVRVRLEAPAVLTRGDRFILRAYSPPVTIGGGVVLDPHPAHGPLRSAAALARFRRLDASETQDPDAAARVFVEERQGSGLRREELVSRAGLSPAEASLAVARLVKAGHAVEIEGWLVAPSAVAALSERLTAAVKAHHAAQPLSDGLPREEARERIFGRAPAAVFEHVLAALAARQVLGGRDRLALAGRQVALSAEESAAQSGLERVYRDAGLAPPDLASAAAAAGVAPAVADRISRLLLRQKVLVKVDTLLFHADALEGLKSDVRAMKGTAGARVDVAAFKERYGITRKYAIPLLEYLDRERLTRRTGDSRVVL